MRAEEVSGGLDAVPSPCWVIAVARRLSYRVQKKTQNNRVLAYLVYDNEYDLEEKSWSMAFLAGEWSGVVQIIEIMKCC